MDNIIFYALLAIAVMLIFWIRIKSTDQNQLRKKLISTLVQSGHLIQLLQVRRVLMTDTDKNLSQNEVKLIGNNANIEKLIYSLDTDKTIFNNEYWNAFLDHWKRMKFKGFATSKAVLFQQHSNLVDSVLLMQKERLSQSGCRELFTEVQWLSECIWSGIANIAELLQRIDWLSKPGSPTANSSIPLVDLIEKHLVQFDILHKQWLVPLNQKGIPLDPNLIIRTLSSCERTIRVYKQEIATVKNRAYSAQSFSAIVSEALSNLHTLQSQMIAHLKIHYHLK